MGNICKLLAKIYGILGLIGTIMLSYHLGKVTSINKLTTKITYDRNWILTIAIFVGVGLSVITITIILQTIGEIYDQIYDISFNPNSILSADAQNGLAKLGKEVEDNHILSNGGWKCPDCNKVNYSYNTTCKCGCSKP